MKLRHLIAALAPVLLCGCPDGSDPAAGPDAPQPIAVELIPFLEEAASMPAEVLDAIASAPSPPVAEDHDDQNLTLFITCGLRVPEPGEEGPEGFRFMKSETYSVVQLVKLLDRTRPKGYVSVLVADDVTKVSGVKDDQGVVRGRVEWENELFAAKADYVARTHEGTWQVTEFDVPGVGKLALDDAGTWKIVSRADAPQPSSSGE